MKHVGAIAIFIFMLLLAMPEHAFCQQTDRKEIERLITDDKPEAAAIAFESKIRHLKTSGHSDSIAFYIELNGYLNEALFPVEKAIKKTEEFSDAFLNSTTDLYLKKEALLELASFYDTMGQNTLAFEGTQQALGLALQLKDQKKQGLEILYYNLGLRAKNMGNVAQSKQFHLKALKLLEKNPSNTTESLFNSYNSLGGVMYYQAKLDSALYYFDGAVAALKKAKYDPLNTYYRKAMVQANMAVIEQTLGNPQKAIDLSKEVIEDYSCYLEITTDASRKLRVIRFLGMSLDNLGSFYNAVGMFKKADDIITHSYNFKMKHLPENDGDLIISKILLAQSKMSLREFETADILLHQALEMMEMNGEKQLYWECSALQALADNYREMGNSEMAELFYNKMEPLRIEVFGEDYNNDFLDVSNRMAIFFAEHGNEKKAFAIANDTYKYALKIKSGNSLLLIKQLLALGEVSYVLGDYEKALEYGESALKTLDLQQADNPIDSIYVAFRKPGAVLLKLKSQYKLTPHLSETFLKTTAVQLNEALEVLEKRKSILTDTESLQALLTENEELISFSKKIQLDLFEKTKNQQFLKNALALHESALYSRIRSRLSMNANTFAGVPKSILEEETKLKKTLDQALTEKEGDALSGFFDAQREWEDFLRELKTNQPAYYKMRYETITENIDFQNLPFDKNATVVRYFYNKNELYAAVIKGNETQLVPLDGTKTQTLIRSIDNRLNVETESRVFHALYNELWKPLFGFVKTEKVVIVPDRELFNVSFESLLKKPASSYKAMAENSLLQDYVFSYNYSLLVGNNAGSAEVLEAVTAFAPVFSADLKSEYREQLTDSIAVDEAYLKLLSQPFTHDLARGLHQEFGATVFLKEAATKANFLKNTGGNSILHIGTHAMSDNLRPELSQLVFAKNEADFEADNILYAHEIYGVNIPAKLTVLTACETGKPGYQPGEGMISLAHAFNYAGSESLLTSLWKIDEASSAAIVTDFYENLERGLPKDEALRNAKLEYLKQADGRTLAPQYWAGLVVMGDVAPIELNQSRSVWWVFGAGFLCVAGLGFLAIKRKKLKSRNS